MSTDQIERSIVIKAPAERVWRALSTPQEFGAWFGVKLEGAPFEPGQHARGPITIAGFEHVIFNAWIERVKPPSLLSYRRTEAFLMNSKGWEAQLQNIARHVEQ